MVGAFVALMCLGVALIFVVPAFNTMWADFYIEFTAGMPDFMVTFFQSMPYVLLVIILFVAIKIVMSITSGGGN